MKTDLQLQEALTLLEQTAKTCHPPMQMLGMITALRWSLGDDLVMNELLIGIRTGLEILCSGEPIERKRKEYEASFKRMMDSGARFEL